MRATHFIGAVSEKFPFTVSGTRSLIDNLSEAEYIQLQNALSTFSQFENTAQIYLISSLNFKDYYEAFKYYQDLTIKAKTKPTTSTAPFTDLNRKLLNILSATRSFLDYLDKNLKYLANYGPKLFEQFGTYTSLEFDSNVSYRFFEAVRNYTQHCGLPIHSFKLIQEPSPNDRFTSVLSLKAFIHRNKLLNGASLSKKKKEALSVLPEQIDVNTHLQSYLESLQTIFSKFSRDEFEVLKESTAYIYPYIEKVGGFYTNLVLASFFIEDEPPNQQVYRQSIPIPVNLLQAALNGSVNDVIKTVEFDMDNRGVILE